MKKNNKYNSYWIRTTTDGSGVQINTHPDYILTINDVYINKNNDLLISYVNIQGKSDYSRAILHDKGALQITSI